MTLDGRRRRDGRLARHRACDRARLCARGSGRRVHVRVERRGRRGDVAATRALGATVAAFQSDVADTAAVTQAFQDAKAALGGAMRSSTTPPSRTTRC
jgi:hypothetical protein